MEKNKKDRRLKVLVVGVGMYAAGRGRADYGTIMPALNELCRDALIDTITAASTSRESITALMGKIRSLRKMTGTGIKVAGFPKKGKDPQAYRKALSSCAPDCAIVCVPDHLHYGIATDLIRSGVHTLIVKPLTDTLERARRLADLAGRKNVYAAVEFHKRYDEANLKLKDVLTASKLGDLLYINVEYSQRRSIPLKAFKKWVRHTNVFQYLGVHYVDVIYFAAGAKPLRALAVGQKQLLSRSGIDNYDSIQAVIEWAAPGGKRFISTILTNWIDPDTTSAMSDQKIKAVGTMGRYESDQKDRGVRMVTEAEGIEDINPYFTKDYPVCGTKSRIFKGYGIESVMQFCKDVLNIKRGLNVPSDFDRKRPTFKDALVSTAVIEAVSLSLRNGSSWVKVRA